MLYSVKGMLKTFNEKTKCNEYQLTTIGTDLNWQDAKEVCRKHKAYNASIFPNVKMKVIQLNVVEEPEMKVEKSVRVKKATRGKRKSKKVLVGT